MIARLKMRWNDVTKPKVAKKGGKGGKKDAGKEKEDEKKEELPPKPKTAVVYVATEFLDW